MGNITSSQTFEKVRTAHIMSVIIMNDLNFDFHAERLPINKYRDLYAEMSDIYYETNLHNKGCKNHEMHH